MSPPIEDHPVLVREVVRRDGSRGLALRVFCSRRRESVPLETCEACPSCVEVAPDVDGTSALVRCSPPRDDATTPPTDDPQAGDDLREDCTPVGAILRGATLCIACRTEVRELRALMVEGGLPGVFVVDEGGRLAGLVRERDLVIAPRLTPNAGRAAPEAGVVRLVGAVMSTATSVEEFASVCSALRRMAGAHLREVPVITRDGQLVGVLRDIEGLRWIADQRRGERSGP